MNEPTDESTKTSKHENVMVLAMSTLLHQPKVNTYQIEENGQVRYFHESFPDGTAYEIRSPYAGVQRGETGQDCNFGKFKSEDRKTAKLE